MDKLEFIKSRDIKVVKNCLGWFFVIFAIGLAMLLGYGFFFILFGGFFLFLPYSYAVGCTIGLWVVVGSCMMVFNCVSA